MKKILTLLLLMITVHVTAQTYYRRVINETNTPTSNLWVNSSQPSSGTWAKVGLNFWSKTNLGNTGHLANSSEWANIMPGSQNWLPVLGLGYSYVDITGPLGIGMMNTSVFETDINYKPTNSNAIYRFNTAPILASTQFSESHFSVYPNPTSSMLNIDSDKEFSASLYDLTGKKLLNFSTKTFDISQLASGIYYLDIISEDKRYTKKIVKE